MRLTQVACELATLYNRAKNVGDIHQSCHLVGVVSNVHTLCGSAPSSSPILCLLGGHRLD